MRLEKPILFASTDKDRFQINPHYNEGFYQINRFSFFFKKNSKLSADNVGFSAKPAFI